MQDGYVVEFAYTFTDCTDSGTLQVAISSSGRGAAEAPEDLW